MGTHNLTEATTQLYKKQPGDEGKTPVIIDEQECRALEMSGALAVRHSGLPYYPVPKDTPGTPVVRVEFDPPEAGEGVSQVDEIPAALEFVDETGERVPGSKAIALSAQIMATGDSWNEMELTHTGGLDMDRDELAGLIFDAYRDGTVMENEARHWNDLRDTLESLKEMASHAATCVLKGPAPAMEDMMEQHMGKFFPHPVPSPKEGAQAPADLARRQADHDLHAGRMRVGKDREDELRQRRQNHAQAGPAGLPAGDAPRPHGLRR